MNIPWNQSPLNSTKNTSWSRKKNRGKFRAKGQDSCRNSEVNEVETAGKRYSVVNLLIISSEIIQRINSKVNKTTNINGITCCKNTVNGSGLSDSSWNTYALREMAKASAYTKAIEIVINPEASCIKKDKSSLCKQITSININMVDTINIKILYLRNHLLK